MLAWSCLAVSFLDLDLDLAAGSLAERRGCTAESMMPRPESSALHSRRWCCCGALLLGSIEAYCKINNVIPASPGVASPCEHHCPGLAAVHRAAAALCWVFSAAARCWLSVSLLGLARLGLACLALLLALMM
jgi:hypothetical protein